MSNVTGEFYPTDADTDTMLDILGRQVASPVQFVKGLHTLYAAGARVFVEVGPKKALHGFVEDVLGGRRRWRCSPTTPSSAISPSFNQALCGLYAAGLGYARDARRRRHRRPATATVRETPMTATQYAELGRQFVDVGSERPACRATAGRSRPGRCAGRLRAGGGHRRGAGPARGRAGLR